MCVVVVGAASNAQAAPIRQSKSEQPPQYLLQSEQQPPANYRVEYRPAKGRLYSGIFLGSMAYIVGFSMAAADGFENHTAWLTLPIAGPWITLATRHRVACSDWFCNEVTNTALVLDGCVQLAAATLITMAFAAPRRWAVRQEPSRSILLRPMSSAGTYGLSLDARF
jgi:hypothetical protein